MLRGRLFICQASFESMYDGLKMGKFRYSRETKILIDFVGLGRFSPLNLAHICNQHQKSKTEKYILIFISRKKLFSSFSIYFGSVKKLNGL